MWAPDVQKTGDHFTMTYAGSGGGGNFDIYYATSASAAGPFKFRGLLVSGGYTSKYDLDPNIYMSSGGPILYYGSGTQGITAVKLSIAADGTIQTTGAKKIILDVNPTTEWIAEGAWMQKHDNYYYLYYSVGRYDFSAPSRPAYHVRVARSTNPMGPFEKSNKPVIEGNAAFLRPGHNSITTDNAGAEWMVYHAYESPNRSDRKLMIDPITYTGGWPIVRDGHPSVGIQQDGPANGADGGSLTTGKGGWIWPLKKGVNDGPCYGGPRVHAGMDMNSKTTNNPVYAMHDGTVSRTVDQGARGGGTYIIIKATGAGANYNGKPVFYGLQHLVPGSRTAKEGDKVKVGQKIGIAGHSGNVSLGASKAHLHVTMSSSNSVGEYGNLGDTFDPMNILKDAGKAPEGYKCYNG
jgi:arabinan endo-1,5-alpha-L-arabinosidase